jgi:type 1 glutamine amidotransferase
MPFHRSALQPWFVLILLAWLLGAPYLVGAEARKILFIAGSPSHGPGEHEHRAGCLLLQACLEGFPGVTSLVCSNDWPENPEAAFKDVATVVIYSNGGGGHPVVTGNRLAVLGEAIRKGSGLVCLHYAVEPTLGKGQKEFLEWLGGCFETHWSVNPTWTPDLLPLPQHPVSRGVNLFKVHDEWYFHMRFRDGMQGVTPVLSAVPPASTLNRPDGPHEGNPAVRAAVKRGEPQVLAWAAERADGGRGFGFTGGHFHKSWGNDDLRRLVLNAILWTAKVEVPPDGVPSKVSPEDLKKNHDRKGGS